jgi:hypothetical protein
MLGGLDVEMDQSGENLTVVNKVARAVFGFLRHMVARLEGRDVMPKPPEQWPLDRGGKAERVYDLSTPEGRAEAADAWSNHGT